MESVGLLEISRASLRGPACPGGGPAPPPWGLQEPWEGLGVSSVVGVGASPKTKAGRGPPPTLAVLEGCEGL